MPSTTTAQPHRRLSSRRGSITAPDPFALHADINEAPDRTSSSKLTIVRVLPQQQGSASPPVLNDPPSSFTSVSRRRSYRMGATSPPPDGAPTGRLSFAFSSFGSGEHGGGHHREGSTGSQPAPPSPTSSPRLRPTGPSSPRLSAIGGSSFPHSKPRLTPEQLVELARQATDPRTLAQIASTAAPSAGPSSPAPPGSPVLRAHSPALGGGATPGTVAPATFTPLPDDIYLPFIDRPNEVSLLISTPPDAKLFNLLAQTLPRVYDGPVSSLPQDPNDTVQLPPDPSRWTFTHLHTHLTQVDRDVDSDVVWVAKSRKCIMSHSELIWERVKGCFGVPPELDGLDWDWEREERIKASLNALEEGHPQRRNSAEKQKERMRRLRAELREGAPKPSIRGGKLQGKGAKFGDSAIDSESEDESTSPPLPVANRTQAADPPNTATTVATEDISSDEGKAPGGHWSDWDEAIESPIHAKAPLREGEGQNIGITAQSPSVASDEETENDFIEIEALVASSDPSSQASPNPPPLSGSMLLGTQELAEGNLLGDIAEGEEDEDEPTDSKAAPEADTKPETGETQEPEDEVIPPSQIQGLRISTAPVHASGSYGVGGVYAPHHNHPFPSNKSDSGASPDPASASPIESTSLTASETITSLHRTHSRTSSFSSMTGVSIGPFQRSESTGHLGALMAAHANHSNPNYSGSEAGDSTGYLSDSVTTRTRDTLGDRQPGHPLFVSNFARLNGLPTLSTNNHSHSPPHSSGAHHSQGKMRVKRTGSSAGLGVVGSVPSSSFVGSKAGLTSGSELFRTRTNSQGSTSRFVR